MNAVDDSQSTEPQEYFKMDHIDNSTKDKPLKTTLEVQNVPDVDGFEEGSLKVKEQFGFDGGTFDRVSIGKTTNGNGEGDSSEVILNGIQNGSFTAADKEADVIDDVGNDSPDDDGVVCFKKQDIAGVYLKSDCGDNVIAHDASDQATHIDDSVEVDAKGSRVRIVDLKEDDNSGECEGDDLGEEDNLKESGIEKDVICGKAKIVEESEANISGDCIGGGMCTEHKEEDREEISMSTEPQEENREEISMNTEHQEEDKEEISMSTEHQEEDQEEIRDMLTEVDEDTTGEALASVGGEKDDNMSEAVVDSGECRDLSDSNSLSLDTSQQDCFIGEDQDVADEVRCEVAGNANASRESKDFNDSSSMSLDTYQLDSQDGQVEGDKDDEDPEALTIDTGRLSGGEGDGIKRAEVVENAIPVVSQPPSDDDVDPDALTIDTTAIEEETKTDDNGRKEMLEQVNGNVVRSISDLKLTINYKGKKAGVKKTKRNMNKLATKGIKRRVPRVPTPNALKCPRCPLSSFTTVTALLDHQRSCGIFSSPTPASLDVPKVPRKVYMCSACGSYFENWNLFLHMKEMHKRNICLHCLGMFSQAGKLTQHLAAKHGVIEQVLEYGDQLALKYPGPQLLLCSRCDRMCTDQDFESHSCSTVCSHCGLAGTHYPTCRLAPPASIKPIKASRRRARAPKRPKKQTIVPPNPLTQPVEKTPDFSPTIEPPSPAEELSPNTYNERMLQLYRNNKPHERSFSTLESIEESINRVVDGLLSQEEEMDTNQSNQPVEDSVVEEELEPIMEEAVPSPPPVQQPPVMAEQSEPESSDSEKLTIELEPRRRTFVERPAEVAEEPDTMLLAGEETAYTCVPLPEPLDIARVPTAMKLFLRATALTCVYCAHARKIAVNAKQLALHQLAQHRYVTVSESTPPLEKAACYSAVVRVIREALSGLDTVYFNAYGFDSSDRTAWRSADRVYECFHCSYITPDLREFTSHNRKIHCNDLRKTRQSESHLCIMCKTRFLTYSELLCHLCQGVYIPGRIIDPHCRYRCYSCDIEPLPSSFRLMVHLRQTHTACDMCFTLCDSQAALSAHVLKHKSLFYCYACALTYETRMELSKHIFWKHGAESVTCKRCLQKKWKHAYHFCLPPSGFPCDACGSWFKTAATLRVHSRFHSGEFPHACTECPEKFISRKLLAKHAATHSHPPPTAVNGGGTPALKAPEEKKKKEKKSKKDLRDLFDLPPVNLSESDDSSGDEQSHPIKEEETKNEGENENVEAPPGAPPVAGPSTEEAPVTVWDGVLASLEEKAQGRSYPPDSPFHNLPLHRVTAIMLADHDYCRPAAAIKEDPRVGLDHDYCNNGMVTKLPMKHSPRKPSKRRNRSSSSDSSSSSSSSCSCGSNCSCSSSSSSTESASSGEPRPRNKKGGKSDKRKDKVIEVKPDPEPEPSVDVCEVRIQESDLETDEPITDDEAFYELNPALRASEVLRLNRSMLLDKLDCVPSASQLSPSPRRKGKSKKKRSGHSSRMSSTGAQSPRGSRPYSTPHYASPNLTDESSNVGDSDGRRPRRKRVPLKFYGFSSGEEDEMAPAPPRKRERLVEHNTTIAASPPARAPSPEPEPSNLWNPPAWRAPPVPPRVHPIKIRTGSLKQTFAKSVNSDEFHIKRAELGGFHVNGAYNASANAEKNEKLYCFCQCPYDEVSEMIACDAHDCVIEWFHFECVGIMDPPKGKWYCPDCKKKAAAESEMMSIPLR